MILESFAVLEGGRLGRGFEVAVSVARMARTLTIGTRETSETSAEISRDKAARTLAHTVSIIASPRVPPSQAPRT